MRLHRLLLLFAFILASIARTVSPVAAEGDSPLAGDALHPPLNRSTFAVDDDPRPSRYQPSLFLAGRVAVQVIFVESDGTAEQSTEDWTNDQLTAAKQRIGAALDWWRDRLPNAHLDFDLTTQIVPSAYEPIQHGLNGEGLWIGDVLTRLGYVGASYFDQAYSADDALRHARHTDWGATIFVVNSAADDDGRLTSGHFAYAYVGGPFLVITSDVGPYGASQMTPVVAHEFGHIFGALDQYASAGVLCTQRSGYLAVPTSNSQANDCGTRFVCIMLDPVTAYSAGQVDRSAAGQLGYEDTDGDGLPDPIDTTPVLTATLTQSSEGRPTVSARAVDQPFPSFLGDSATINTIARVEYRVDQGDWIALPAKDGAYDSPIEALATTLPLYDGQHAVELRAVNSVGAFSPVVRKIISVQGVGMLPNYQLDAPALSKMLGITLTLTAPVGSSFMIGEDPFFKEATWSPFQSSLPWQLQLGDGAHTLYVRFRDSSGLESPPLARSVLLDRVPPSALITLRHGSPSLLELQASDAVSGVAAMQVTFDGVAGDWQPFQPTLAIPPGISAIQIRLRDVAGNVSAPIVASARYQIYLPLLSLQ